MTQVNTVTVYGYIATITILILPLVTEFYETVRYFKDLMSIASSEQAPPVDQLDVDTGSNNELSGHATPVQTMPTISWNGSGKMGSP